MSGRRGVAPSGYAPAPGSTPGAPSGRPAPRRREGLVGRRLKVVSVVAPVVFILLLELLHALFEGADWWSPTLVQVWRIGLAVGVAVCIVAFALMMLRHIRQAEAEIVAQNHDLRLADAVSSASHGHPSAQAVVDAAAAALAEEIGASHARLRLFLDEDATLEATAGPHGVAARTTVPVVDRPLRGVDRVVGRLEVWSADADGVRTTVGPATEAALANQVFGAAQLARDVASLHRRRDEGHAFYAILLSISRQAGTLPTLTAIAQHARDLLGADAAAVVINVATANSVRFDADADVPVPCSDGTTLFGVGLPDHTDPATGIRINPVTCDCHWSAAAEREVVGPQGGLGSLWVGRHDDRPFTDRDRSFLGTMAGLAAIAVTSAQVREDARQREVLNERTRIAREMHDSMAQVLGAMHLRLRMLEGFPAVTSDPDATSEVAALAETAEEAYRDVREVILGLRDADKAELGLEENLRAYVAKYAAASGIAAEFRNETGGPLVLSPRTEVHLIRVVQEALTNVRKHAAASHATVTVTGDEATTSFTITDDGRGFRASDGSRAGEGYGLFTMRDRLSLLHGKLAVDSAPGRGTRVVATVPEPANPTDPRATA